MAVDKRIKKEIARLKKIYKELPDNRFVLVLPLIENAAFMRVTLDDLQESIAANGVTEEYKNGANQYGTKASAELSAYNSTVKNYTAVIDRLDKMLPAAAAKSRLAALRDE